MKKLWPVILSLAMMLSIVGCGPSGGNSNGSGNSSSSSGGSSDVASVSSSDSISNSSESSSVSGATQAPSSFSGTSQLTSSTKKATTTSVFVQTTPSSQLYNSIKGSTVNLLFFDGQMNEVYKAEIKAFETKYKVSTKITTLSWNTYRSQLTTLVKAGNIPDFIGLEDEDFLNWLGAGVIQPLDHYFNLSDSVWDKMITDRYSWKGQHYAVGNLTNAEPMMIAYNQTLFEKANEKTPLEYYQEGNWTFNTLRKVARDMTSGSNPDKPDVLGFATPWRDSLMMANGGQGLTVNNNAGTVSITYANKADAAGLQILIDMRKDKSYDPGGAVIDNFAKGKIAMYLERPYYVVGYYNLRSTMRDTIGIAPVPKGPDVSKYTAPYLIPTSGIPVNAKNPLGGAAWIYFSTQYGLAHTNDPDQVAARKLTYTDGQYQMMLDYKKIATPNNTLDLSVGTWENDQWPFWNDMLNNGLSVQAAVDKYKGQMTTEINKAMKIQ